MWVFDAVPFNYGDGLIKMMIRLTILPFRTLIVRQDQLFREAVLS